MSYFSLKMLAITVVLEMYKINVKNIKKKRTKQVGIEHFIERKIILQTATTTTTLSAGRVGWDWSHILCGEETFILVLRLIQPIEEHNIQYQDRNTSNRRNTNNVPRWCVTWFRGG